MFKYFGIFLFHLIVAVSCFSERTGEVVIVNEIVFKGNKVTNNHILLREIPFAKGDTLDTAVFNVKLLQAKQNLLNTSLFNFVDIYTLNNNNNETDIYISLIERHYIWPLPFFEIADRNFNTWFQKKDLSRTVYGIYVVLDNFRGRHESLKLLVKGGLDQGLGLSYSIPYINKNKTLGLGFSLAASATDDIAYKTEYDKPLFFNMPGEKIKVNSQATFQVTYRPDIYNYHIASVSYNSLWLADTVLALNPEFAFSNTQRYFSILYIFRNDHRDFKPYPLKGYMFECSAEKAGIGILNNENINMLKIEASFRKYSSLGGRFYFGAGLWGRISAGENLLYYNKNVLGFGNSFVRGYEYYAVNGLHCLLAKMNFKYEILPQKVFKLPLIPFEKFSKVPLSFYLNLYSDMAFVYDNGTGNYNSLPNNRLLGKGVGLDFVTYYDKILRIEYSFNGLKENGLFFHFISPL